jgi:galactokinase/mevalonate kinase-like predicted kinase
LQVLVHIKFEAIIRKNHLESNSVTYLSNVYTEFLSLAILSFHINNDELSKIIWENKREYMREKGGWRDPIQFGGITFVSFNLFVTSI